MCIAGEDVLRLNAARHDICMLLSRVLTEQDVCYSLPALEMPFERPATAQGRAVRPDAPGCSAAAHHAVSVCVNSADQAASTSRPVSHIYRTETC